MDFVFSLFKVRMCEWTESDIEKNDKQRQTEGKTATFTVHFGLKRSWMKKTNQRDNSKQMEAACT